ncbi:MAG: hypothetical protein SFV15_02205 [Polyangiaceae bacterium]|nr:hypothetical protein [Polyangiaceae bacterium]
MAIRNDSRIAAFLGVICSLAGCQKGYIRANNVDWVGADERVVIGELIVEDKTTALGYLYFQDSEDFGNPKEMFPLRGLTQDALQSGGVFSVRADQEPFYLTSIGVTSTSNVTTRAQMRPLYSSSGQGRYAVTHPSSTFNGVQRETGTIVVNLEFPKAKDRCEYVGTLRIKQGHVELLDNFELAKQRLARSVANCALVSNIGKIR